MVNPADAERYGVEDGQWVWIENDHGRFRQVCKVTPRVAPGVVHAEHGWWFPEQEASEPSLFGTFDSNPNNCTRAFETGEGGIGSAIKSMNRYTYRPRGRRAARRAGVRAGRLQ